MEALKAFLKDKALPYLKNLAMVALGAVAEYIRANGLPF